MISCPPRLALRNGLRHPLGPLFLLLLAGVAIPVRVIATAPRPDRSGLASALETYESGMAKLVQSDSPEERAAAIQALALVASRRYLSARDALLSDKSPQVKEALLGAIGIMGDDSSPAVAFVETCLGSSDPEMARTSARIACIRLQTPVSFVRFWNPTRPIYLWSQGGGSSGMDYSRIRGVAAAKPWLDPAWAGLKPEVQTMLLIRAGTRESITLGIDRISKRAQAEKGDANWSIPIPCEIVDRDFILGLLKDPNPRIQQFAARSLLEAHDPDMVALIKNAVYNWLWKSGIANVPDSYYVDWQVWRALEYLDVGSLRELAKVGPKDQFFSFAKELDRRGNPFTYKELMGRDGANGALNIGALTPTWLRHWQLRALVREEQYSELPDQITFSMMATQGGGVGELTAALADSPSFLSNMPADLAHRCFEQVRTWMEKVCAGETNEYRRNECQMQFWPLLGQMARGEDEEALWRAWRTSKTPLQDQASLTPVIWCPSQRSHAVREMFARFSSQRSFQNGPGRIIGQALKNVPSDRRPVGSCPGKSADAFQWLGVLPSTPGAVASLKDVLLSAARSDGTPYTRDDIASALLERNGLAFSCDDSVAFLRALGDARMPVRKAAVWLCSATLPPNANNTEGLGLGDLKQWIQEKTPDILGRGPEPPLPGPPLTDDDRAWIEGLFSGGREAYFKGLVGGILKPQSERGGCYIGPPPVQMYAQLPSRVLLDAGTEYDAEIRTLLDSRYYPVRHAAAWALWNRFRDPAALSVFLKDAESVDLTARASALYVLQTIRHGPSASLFPPLLRETSPGLRQVGLLGVQAFGIRGSLPEVENLVTDRDGAVAQVAVTTLGVLHPPEARSLLLALVFEDGPLAHTATQALASYRSAGDVDFFVARLSQSDATEREKGTLTGILSKITGHPSLQWWSDYPVGGPKPQSLDPATVKDWTAWWASQRGRTAGDRLKDVLTFLVEGVLREKDEASQNRFKYQLRGFFPGLSYLEGPWPINARGQSLLKEWWQAHKSMRAWELMTCEEANPISNLALLADIDQTKTRHLVFTAFMHQARSEVIYFHIEGGGESLHQLLVKMSGLDFGNPLVAQCGARDQILTNWEEWARKEGWAQ